MSGFLAPQAGAKPKGEAAELPSSTPPLMHGTQRKIVSSKKKRNSINPNDFQSADE
jgi:hypothetical protein